MSPKHQGLNFDVVEQKTKRRHPMKYYAGLDVAMKETFMCVVDEAGKRVFESKVTTSPQAIYGELIKSGVKLEKVGHVNF